MCMEGSGIFLFDQEGLGDEFCLGMLQAEEVR